MFCNATDPEQAAIDTLLIGYGNALRSDDGVGPTVVELIRQSLGPAFATSVTCRTDMQLTPELAPLIASVRRVIFVDASVAVPAGRVTIRRIAAQPTAACLGHQFSPPQILELARLAFGCVPQAWIVAVGVQSLAVGQGLTAAVEDTARRLAGHLRYHLLPIGKPSFHWTSRNTRLINEGRCSVARALSKI